MFPTNSPFNQQENFPAMPEPKPFSIDNPEGTTITFSELEDWYHRLNDIFQEDALPLSVQEELENVCDQIYAHLRG